MDDDVFDVEAISFAARQVVVAIVAGVIGIVLVIGGRDEAAREALGAISAGMLVVDQVQCAGGASVGLNIRGPQRHFLAIVCGARYPSLDRRVYGVGETQRHACLL